MKIKNKKIEYIEVITEEIEDDVNFKSRITKKYPNGIIDVSYELTDKCKEALTIPNDALNRACGVKKLTFIDKLIKLFKEGK